MANDARRPQAWSFFDLLRKVGETCRCVNVDDFNIHGGLLMVEFSQTCKGNAYSWDDEDSEHKVVCQWLVQLMGLWCHEPVRKVAV